MSNTFHKLWVDDEREIPDNSWDRAYSFHEAIFKLDLLQYDEVSLDHDLASFYGYTEMTGYHIVQWLVQRKMDGEHVPSKVAVHSANPVGRDNMQALIDKHLTEKE